MKEWYRWETRKLTRYNYCMYAETWQKHAGEGAVFNLGGLGGILYSVYTDD